MVFVKNWEDFETAAEGMYTRSPDSSRFSMKYAHHKGEIILKLTDNNKVTCLSKMFPSFENLTLCRLQCIQYKTDIMPDLRKIEKFTGHMMGLMAKTD